MNEDVTYVTSVAPGIWILKGSRDVRADLENLPTKIESDISQTIVHYDQSDERIAGQIAERLRSLGYLFSAGRDWSPEAYLLYLREQNLFSGPIPVIEWTAPGEARRREA